MEYCSLFNICSSLSAGSRGGSSRCCRKGGSGRATCRERWVSLHCAHGAAIGLDLNCALFRWTYLQSVGWLNITKEPQSITIHHCRTCIALYMCMYIQCRHTSLHYCRNWHGSGVAPLKLGRVQVSHDLPNRCTGHLTNHCSTWKSNFSCQFFFECRFSSQ